MAIGVICGPIFHKLIFCMSIFSQYLAHQAKITTLQVQTDCSTPALANFGSDRLKREFLIPALAGDVVTSIAVSIVTLLLSVEILRSKLGILLKRSRLMWVSISVVEIGWKLEKMLVDRIPGGNFWISTWANIFSRWASLVGAVTLPLSPLQPGDPYQKHINTPDICPRQCRCQNFQPGGKKCESVCFGVKKPEFCVLFGV